MTDKNPPVLPASRPNLATPPIASGLFDRLSTVVGKATGSGGAFMLAFMAILIWAVCGPFFRYSAHWQLVINTGTSVITFLMVFLIQKAQNKDSLAIQLKLNELIAAHEFASNRLVNVESMTEAEMKVIQKYYAELSEITMKEKSLQTLHSIDEAQQEADERGKQVKEAGQDPT